MINVKEIDKLYFYNKDDLGYSFYGNKSTFKLWSPLAEEVELCIYDDYNNSETYTSFNMIKEDTGVWNVSVEDSLIGKYYTYKVKINGEIQESVDPYGKAFSINGGKTAIISMENTKPENWDNHKRPKFEKATDAIIYEVHTRDFSIDEASGIKHKGKFLAFTEEDTVDSSGTKTGLSHIKDLGVTHVQLLPIFDFASIDESNFKNSCEVENKEPYNWGYDPANYNVPEGSYSTDPFNPECRIKELKMAIKSIHENGLGVIMDVVYNHMYEVANSSFHKTMPGYFFRYDDEGKLLDESGCGNVIASENAMVRKYIVDSVKYWAEEYKLDGFRFDLMGLLDVQTMNEVRDELKKINPSILIIGEGWNMGDSLSENEKAIQKNAYKMKNIGFFNDTVRDALRGNAFKDDDIGLLASGKDKEIDVKKAIVGGINYSEEINLWGEVEPDQVVNYVECHDNHTLFDKLNLVIENEEYIKYSHRFGSSIVLLSQGIPFIHAGQEFFKTKSGIENSYNANDSINKMDWNRKRENIDNIEYIKGLIRIRKKYDEFRMDSVEDIRKNIKFIEGPENSISYILKSNHNKILVVHNGNNDKIKISIDSNLSWHVLVNKYQSGLEVIEKLQGDCIEVDAMSTLVAIK